MLNQCEIANCNNRGSCIAGKCVCQNGYQGKFCEQSMIEFNWEIRFFNFFEFFLNSFMSKYQL